METDLGGGNLMKKTALISAFVVAATCVAATATTILGMSLEEMTRRSDQIVIAKAKAVSYSTNEKTGYPETRTTFTVEDTLFGKEEPSEVVVAVPGGPVGNGLYTVVPNMPKFKVDDRAVLFLVVDKDNGNAFPTGAEQGVFRIKVDPDTQEAFVQNQAHDLSIVNLPDNPVAKRMENKSRVGLGDFRATVRQLATKVKDGEAAE